MEKPIKVSIIINNYNYGRFLRMAVDSALIQNYQPIEVIVVDDGSTDDSRSILSSYSDEVKVILKDNGGQASAFNAGFAQSSGEVIIFLDSDDQLLPHVTSQVAQVFGSDSEVVKVQYRLAIIDDKGVLTGQLKPPIQKALARGDLRKHLMSFPDDLCWQPTSGNAWRANVLNQILPIPEQPYRLCADYYLSNLTPLYGKVFSLDTIGGCYRVHGANAHFMADVDVTQSRQIINQSSLTHSYIQKFANSLGLVGFPSAVTDVLSVTFLAHRMVSLRLDPKLHPLRSDTIFSLLKKSARAAWGRFDRPWSIRILYMFWFFAVALAPAPMVRWLARKFFFQSGLDGFAI